jgi:hypothetical protein
MHHVAYVLRERNVGLESWMINRATALHLAFQRSEIPELEVGTGCVYCPFIKSCPKSAQALMVKEAKK